MNNNAGTSQLCAELSWNGGTSWTAPKSVALTTSAITTYTLGAANDTLGPVVARLGALERELPRPADRRHDRPTRTSGSTYLAVQVTYTP